MLIMYKKIVLSLALMITASTEPLSAWWDVGHMTVAKIAYDELTPEVRQQVDLYLETVSGPFPNHSNFMSASIWADDIANDGLNAFWVWHGSAQPYDPQNILTEEEHQAMIDSFIDHDIVWAIEECMHTISNPKASPWAKGFMLRMLIHIMGDVHQPLHCASLYSKDFPNGDRAGTRFKIIHPQFKSLHQIFDGVFGLGTRRPEKPMTNEDTAFISDLASELTDMYSRDSFPQLHDNNVDHWRQESYEIAINFAYANIEPNQSVAQSVIDEGQIVTGKQIALAGYRLADFLNDALMPIVQ